MANISLLTLKTIWDDTKLAVQALKNRSIKSAPVTGVKTVTTTAADVFAGASKLASRYTMVIQNKGTVPIYWGGSTVTVSNGIEILPGDVYRFTFDPTVVTAIYCISAADCEIRVVELA